MRIRSIWTAAMSLLLIAGLAFAQPKPKSQKEVEALMAIQNAQDPDQHPGGVRLQDLRDFLLDRGTVGFGEAAPGRCHLEERVLDELSLNGPAAAGSRPLRSASHTADSSLACGCRATRMPFGVAGERAAPAGMPVCGEPERGRGCPGTPKDIVPPVLPPDVDTAAHHRRYHAASIETRCRMPAHAA